MERYGDVLIGNRLDGRLVAEGHVWAAVPMSSESAKQLLALPHGHRRRLLDELQAKVTEHTPRQHG
jgi:hypothetical protein